MAPEHPLLLWRSEYDASRLDVDRMHVSENALAQLETHVASRMHEHRVRAAIQEEAWAHLARARARMTGDADVQALARDLAAVTCTGNVSVAKSRHQRLRDRPTENTFEERLARVEKK